MLARSVGFENEAEEDAFVFVLCGRGEDVEGWGDVGVGGGEVRGFGGNLFPNELFADHCLK